MNEEKKEVVKQDAHIKILITKEERRQLKTMASMKEETFQSLFKERLQELLEEAKRLGL